MTDRFPILPGTTPPVGGTAGVRKPTTGNRPAGPRFDELLDQQLQSTVQFSQHAQQRMQQRGIHFSPQQVERLEQAVSQVNAKGGRDSLVMLDDTALVVSVKNNTVVTVAHEEQLKQNVFTKIDSAIIA